MSQVIFVEGPDRLGKTEMCKKLSRLLRLKVFKAPTEVKNWKEGAFAPSIPFDWMLPWFSEQLELSFISDRGYASEVVYSEAYQRPTNSPMLDDADWRWGGMQAVHVILLPGDLCLDVLPEDELVGKDMMPMVAAGYESFAERTRTRCLVLRVSDYLIGDGSRWDLDRMAAEAVAFIASGAYKKGLVRRGPRD